MSVVKVEEVVEAENSAVVKIAAETVVVVDIPFFVQNNARSRQKRN